MKKYCLNRFDAILYINLHHRSDRKELLLEQLKTVSVDQRKLYRIEGVLDRELGVLGCLKSHIKAIEFAKEQRFENALILEDDCYFKFSPEHIDNMLEHMLKVLNQWDVILLGSHIRRHQITCWDRVFRVTWATCAQAYAINKHYYNTVISFYKNILDTHGSNIFTAPYAALDYYWHKMMEVDQWFCSDIVLHQRPNYSDIAYEHKNRPHPERPYESGSELV